MASRFGAVYTRYADDITLSFDHEDHAKIHAMQRLAREVLASEGYVLHGRKKLSVRRRHHRQVVTGLVVNQRVNLPRPVRALLMQARFVRAESPSVLPAKGTALVKVAQESRILGPTGQPFSFHEASKRTD